MNNENRQPLIADGENEREDHVDLIRNPNIL